MSNTTNTATASASVVFPLTTVMVVGLIIAKLQNLWGLGDLSWVWVFAPYWMGFVVFLAFLLIIGIFVGIGFGVAWILDKRKAKKREKLRQERLANRNIR